MAFDICSNPDRKLVSVVIPVFNRETTLPRLFQSLVQITYAPIEVILIDNNSCDASLDLCHRFQTSMIHNDHICVKVSTQEKPGACACRNLGAKMAQGEFIYFFDSDDEISPDFFTDLLPFCEQNDAVCTTTVMQFEDGTRKIRACIPTSYPYDQILSASISTQSLIIRKDFFYRIGGWDENLFRWNDWELGVRLLCHHPRLKWITGKSYHTIYQHRQSITGFSFAKDYEKLKKTLLKASEDIEKASLNPAVFIKSRNALAGKCLLLAANLYREKEKDLSESAYRLALTFASTARFKLLSPLVFWGGKHKFPGTWRIYRWLI